VALVNESFREMYLPGGWEGAEVRLTQGGQVDDAAAAIPSDDWAAVVGVVPDLWEDPRNPTRNAGVYLPLAQAGLGDAALRLGRWELRYQTALLRTAGPVAGLGPAVQEAVYSEDPSLPVRPVEPLAAVVDAQLARYGLWGRFFLVFAGVGLLLAALGIYGVLAFSVEGRSHEIGIRRALGATAESVASQVVFGALRRVGLGGALGLLLGYWLATGLGQVFYGLDTADVRVWLCVAGLMGVVGILASWIPARRAARIHPADAVRTWG
jgi:hypothetical protein